MAQHAGSCPLTQRELIDLYFLEQRNNVLGLAAFLDRLDRSVELDGQDDFRIRALRESLRALAATHEEPRVERVHAILSDPRTDLLPVLDQKAAKGAYDASATGPA